MTRRCTADRMIHWVNAHHLTHETADAAIENEVEHFRSLIAEFEWKVFSFDQPADLLDRLTKAGFEVGDKEALVMLDVEDGLPELNCRNNIVVRHALSPVQIADYRRVAEAVFQKDFALTESQLLASLATGKPGHDAFIAYVEGEPVSAGRMYTDPNSQFGGLYGGGTVTEFRGRGIYQSVVQARAQFAARQGCRYLLVDALPTSLPILLKNGFEHVADSWPCLFRP